MEKIIVEQFDSIIIITDVEPDDLKAITLFLKSKQIKAKTLYFVISAWTDVEHKARFFRKFLTDCFSEYSNCLIYLGEPSDKKYQLPFELAAEENFSSYKELDPSDSLIINLAPIQELIFFYEKNTNVFVNCQLVIYGSFNVRSVLEKSAIDPAAVYAMIESFSGVLWYETFYAVGQNNSVTDPELLNIIKSDYPYLKKIIEWWNQAIMDDCQKSCDSSDPSSEKYKRNLKVLNAIKEEPYQFVNADTGLMAVLLNPDLQSYAQPGLISFVPKTFYTQFTESANSKIKLVKCHNDSLRLEEIDFFKRVLKN